MANTEKHRKRVDEQLQRLVKKGLLYESSCRLETRETEYRLTKKGQMFGGSKLLKGL